MPNALADLLLDALAMDRDTVFQPSQLGAAFTTGRYVGDTTIDGVSVRTFNVSATAERRDVAMGRHYVSKVHVEGTMRLRSSDAALVELSMQGRTRTLQSDADVNGTRGGRESEAGEYDKATLTFHLWSDCLRGP